MFRERGRTQHELQGTSIFVGTRKTGRRHDFLLLRCCLNRARVETQKDNRTDCGINEHVCLA